MFDDHVVLGFNDGVTMNSHVWRSLTEGRQYVVLRSTRALRDDALTRELVLARQMPSVSA